MKKTFSLSIFILCLNISIYSQHNEFNPNSLSKSIISIADSLRTNYKYYFKFYVNIKDSISFTTGNNFISFEFPPISNQTSAIEIFHVIDSLARTEIYTNKVVANKIASELVQYYSIRRDSVCYYCENKQLNSWQKDLLLNLTMTDIEHCMRMMIDNNDAALFHLPRTIYTFEILDKIKYLFAHPYLRKEEVEIIAQREQNYFNIEDTLGFTFHNINYSKLSNDDKKRIGDIRRDLINAKEVNQTLGYYYDSLNKIEYEKYVNAWTGSQFVGIQQLVDVIALKKIYSLAPLIDSICQQQLCNSWSNFNIGDVLARLNYKSYPETQISIYSSKLDSLINLIENKSLANKAIKSLEKEILANYRKLIYINTQESFCKVAPVLLIKQRSYNENNSYVIGAKFFLSLNDNILNLPWDKEANEDVKFGESPFVVDEWYIENKLPNNFLEEIYDWMINNKGNYLIQEY